MYAIRSYYGETRSRLAAARPVLEARSKLTERYQTTVPEPVRQALNLRKGDKLLYRIQANGDVLLTRAQDEDKDPVVGAFLDFLARDMQGAPDHIRPVKADDVQQLQTLVAGVEFDLHAPLEDDE